MDFNMILYTVIGVAIVLGSVQTQPTVDICEGISKCACVSLPNGTNIKCPQFGVLTLQLSISKSGNKLDLSCNHFAFTKTQNDSIFEDLSELRTPLVTDVSLQFCPLPGKSFEQFTKNLNITKLKKLSFDYSNNDIGEFRPPYLDNLPFLEVLHLTANSNLTGIHMDLLQGIPNLKTLFLRNNVIKTLYAGVFQHVPKLEILDISYNKLTQLDSGIFRNLTSLKILNINNNRLANLTRAMFNSVPNLISLDISGNRIVELQPGVFADLWKLQSFQANKNIFRTFPVDLFTNMKELQIVKIIYHNYTLMALPSKMFSNLPELTNVTVRESNIRSVPPDLFSNSPKLKMISFTGHKRITSLPRELFRDCKNLEILDLSDNCLNELPQEFFTSLEKLSELNLRNNEFKVITTFFFSGLGKLSELNLSNNQIRTIESESLDVFLDIKIIDMSYNNLQLENSEYSDFTQCIRLEELYLQHNRINYIFKDWLSVFSRLRYLDLSYNNITFLEDQFGFLISDNLKLDLSYNNIAIVPLKYLELVASSQIKLKNIVPSVILNNNPVACNCSNYDFIRYVSHTMDTNVYRYVNLITDKIKCSSTGDLINKIVPAHVTCTSELCPVNCTCTYIPYFDSMEINCTSGNLKQLPKYLPINYENKSIKKIELTLTNNSIESLSEILPDGFEFVKYLDLSKNKLSQIQTYSYFNQLEKLDLSNNKFEYLNNSFIEFLSLNYNLSSNSIALYGNPWKCDCNIDNLHRFLLNKHEKVIRSEDVICNGTSKPLSSITVDDFCPSFTKSSIYISISLGVIGLLIGVLAGIYYIYKEEIRVWLFAHRLLLWFVTEEELDWDKKYDAFISFAQEDDDLVLKTLIPELEKDFKICNHLKDFIPGEWIHNQILKCVQDSRRTIIVLSEHFLNSYWGTLEFRTAHYQAVKENRARVIILIVGDVPPDNKLDSEMRAYMKMNTYIKWGDPWFWDKLRYVLPHPPSKPISKMEMGDRSKLFNNVEPDIEFPAE